MTLPVGTPAPAFTAKDANGDPVSLADYAGQTVILYFYPKDDTPGCTKQACGFRDNYADYQDQNIVVLGMSADDEAAHQKFIEKYDLPFPLLADRDRTIIKAYDVDSGSYAKRVTYIIDDVGMITHVYDSVQTATHATDVLAELAA